MNHHVEGGALNFAYPSGLKKKTLKKVGLNSHNIKQRRKDLGKCHKLRPGGFFPQSDFFRDMFSENVSKNVFFFILGDFKTF